MPSKTEHKKSRKARKRVTHQRVGDAVVYLKCDHGFVNIYASRKDAIAERSPQAYMSIKSSVFLFNTERHIKEFGQVFKVETVMRRRKDAAIPEYDPDIYGEV